VCRHCMKRRRRRDSRTRFSGLGRPRKPTLPRAKRRRPRVFLKCSSATNRSQLKFGAE
jgi:hypothetical protein